MNQEYPQVYELGLGSLIGDFFQNVKDTVTGVAKAVAPIAPYVIPFVAPALAGTGIGSLLGGGVGKFLTSKIGQAALGAGIGALAGQKPADIAKNLALQVATSGVRGVLGGGEGTMGQKFMSGVTGKTIPQTSSISTSPINFAENISSGGSYNVSGEATSLPSLFDKASTDFTTNIQVPNLGNVTPEPSFLNKLGGTLSKTFNPMERTINPKYKQLEDLGFSPEKIIASGVSKEAPFTYQYGPALYAGLTALPIAEKLLGPKEEEEVDTTGYEDLYAYDPAAYQIGSITGYDPRGYYLPENSVMPREQAQQIANQFNIPMTVAATGGEVTGFASGSGQQIKHPDGKVMEHPKRIGEIAGPGTGTSDDIPAMLSDGEFVMTAQAVRNAGNGSRKEGAKRMYKMMKNLENGGTLSQQSMGMA